MAANEEGRQSIELKILSPSPEVGNAGLHFDDLPVSTTVSELKDRIRDLVSTRPANERQRLIYLGRALLRESDTLLEVFGTQAVRIGFKSNSFTVWLPIWLWLIHLSRSVNNSCIPSTLYSAKAIFTNPDLLQFHPRTHSAQQQQEQRRQHPLLSPRVHRLRQAILSDLLNNHSRRCSNLSPSLSLIPSHIFWEMRMLEPPQMVCLSTFRQKSSINF
jgi:hypothetical protein